MTPDQRYYRRNRKRKLAYNRCWYQKNKKRIKAYNKAYFQKNKNRTKSRRVLVNASWAKKNPEKKKDYGLRCKYGITLENLTKMQQLQKNLCAICRTPFDATATGKPCVDHDHKTKKVRGLLCSICNFGLGMFKESRSRLAAASRYLARFK